MCKACLLEKDEFLRVLLATKLNAAFLDVLNAYGNFIL